MKVKNYTCAALIKKAIPLFLMMLFVNAGWGQSTYTLVTEEVDLVAGGKYLISNGTSSGTVTFLGPQANNNRTGVSGTVASGSITTAAATLPTDSKPFEITLGGTAGAWTLNDAVNGTILGPGTGSNNHLKANAGTPLYTITFSTNAAVMTCYGTQANSNGRNILRNNGNLFASYSSGQAAVYLFKLAAPTNLVPTVSDVSITGLPNITVQLTGSYTYTDTEDDADASTYQWYTATDDSGAEAIAIDGATELTYTLTTNELGKYVRFGVLAASDTGTSPGVESFSSWVGPVNAVGSPVLNAGTITDFDATCLNATSEPNSFTLAGNNLTSDVTVGALSGFTFSETLEGTYTTSLIITPIAEEINATVFVKFTPMLEQSYDGMITISGGGASDVELNVVGSGVNIPATATTDLAYGETRSTATITGSYLEGCSEVTAYGFEYSITNGFANGTGTYVASNNINGGNFTASLSELASNTTYYYKATATDASGTIYGVQSSFTTLPLEAPTATAATAVIQDSFVANWTAVQGATSYEYDMYKKISEVASSTETFTDAAPTTNPGSYNSRAWSGVDGIYWIANSARVDEVVYTGNPAITLQNVATSSLTCFPIDGNLQSISFDIKQVFSGSGGVVTLSVNHGLNNAEITTVGTYAYDTNVQTIVANVSPAITGPFKITILNNNKARAAIDNLKVVRFDTTLSYLKEDVAVGNVLSTVVTGGLDGGTEYFYRVRAKDANSTSLSSNEIEVTTVGTTTYSDGAWDYGFPTDKMNVIIDDNFTATGYFYAKSLTINSGKVLTIATGKALTVVNEITNNAGTPGLVVANDAAVFQTSTAANTTAFATVERNSTSLFRQDYTLWSSPVVNQNLRNFSPLTLFNRFYSYGYNAENQPNGAYIQEIVTTEDAASKTFDAAQGYLIRMQNTNPELAGYLEGTTPMSFKGTFAGNLNNGDVSIPLTGVVPAVSNGFTLVGNPYPSPIAINTLFSSNPQITQNLYFWRKKNSVNSPASGYATYNALGMVSADAEIEGAILTHIKTGQGFFVQTNDAAPAPLVFTNDMRANTSSIFFKSPEQTPGELHRFWLNLSNASTKVGQTLIAYATNATQEVDSNIDAIYFNDAPTALTSLINNEEYIIQGRSLPFSSTDVVRLGFKTDAAGTFTVSLANFDGLFMENQEIFLKDNATNTLHNLKIEGYTFNTQAGIFNERFEVQYNSTLNTTNPIFDANSILVAVKNQQIKINAGTATINKVELIDVSGRVIYENKGVNATTATIDNLTTANQMLIVRITTAENGVVNQKIVY